MAQGVVAICVVNDLKSVENIALMVKSLLSIKDSIYVPLVVGINKMDLDEKEHVVTKDIVKHAFKEIGATNLTIFNISAKTGENIVPMMEEITRRCLYGVEDVFEILQKIISMDSAVLKDETRTKCSVM